MAKLHLRFMIGGHAKVKNENLFRCQFPERPGALMEFLNSLGKTFNISLFHYRNHGAAFGRILLGIQIPKDKKTTFIKTLKSLNIHYTDETNNPAYPLFLK